MPKTANLKAMVSPNRTLFYSLVLGLGMTCAWASHWEVIKSFPSPTSMPKGLAWDGARLWYGESYPPGYICCINPGDGKCITEPIYANIDNPGDLTWHKGYLWIVDEDNHRLYKLDPATGAHLDSLHISDCPTSAKCQNEGLESDGEYLWVDGYSDYLFQIDPETHAVVTHYKKSWMGYADGIAYAWGHLFIVTNEYGIKEVDPCTGNLLETFDAPAGTGTWGPSALTFDGEYLWFGDQTSKRIYQIRLVDDYNTKMRVTNRIRVRCDTSDIQENKVDLFESGHAKIHPNPFSPRDELRLSFDTPDGLPSTLTIRLLDVSGLIRQQYQVSRSSGVSFTLPNPLLQHAPQGLYFLCYNLNGKNRTLKLLLMD